MRWFVVFVLVVGLGLGGCQPKAPKGCADLENTLCRICGEKSDACRSAHSHTLDLAKFIKGVPERDRETYRKRADRACSALDQTLTQTMAGKDPTASDCGLLHDGISNSSSTLKTELHMREKYGERCRESTRTPPEPRDPDPGMATIPRQIFGCL